MELTEKYYAANATEYIEKTIHADMQEAYDAFLPLVKKGGRILDVGFGSGRDSLYFIRAGYQVTAIDPVEAFCSNANVNGITDVRCLKVQDIEFTAEFDGIWACASLLHLTGQELLATLTKLKKALKPDGVLYLSFKKGDFEGERDGRYYIDLTENSLKERLKSAGFETVKIWTQVDKLGRGNDWVNGIGVKVC